VVDSAHEAFVVDARVILVGGLLSMVSVVTILVNRNTGRDHDPLRERLGVRSVGRLVRHYHPNPRCEELMRNFSQLSSLSALPEARLMNQHREHHPDELVSGGEHRHFVAQPLTPSFVEVGPEEIVGEDDPSRHQPDDFPQMLISPLAYPARPFVLARLIG